MNTYIAELRKRGDSFIARFIIHAANRATAVHKTQLWYWATYKGSLGRAHEVLTVSDPANEVVYDETFNCADKRNRLLPKNIIERVIAESEGELMRDERNGAPHHPTGSVRRVKRRRDFGRFIAPNIRQMKGGLLYYRVVTSPQVSKKGKIIRKRKHANIRLAARTLPEAIEEIRARQLKLEHEKKTRRLFKVRSLKLTAYLIGVHELNDNDKKFFAPVLSRYQSMI